MAPDHPSLFKFRNYVRAEVRTVAAIPAMLDALMKEHRDYNWTSEFARRVPHFRDVRPLVYDLTTRFEGHKFPQGAWKEDKLTPMDDAKPMPKTYYMDLHAVEEFMAMIGGGQLGAADLVLRHYIMARTRGVQGAQLSKTLDLTSHRLLCGMRETLAACKLSVEIDPLGSSPWLVAPLAVKMSLYKILISCGYARNDLQQQGWPIAGHKTWTNAKKHFAEDGLITLHDPATEHTRDAIEERAEVLRTESDAVIKVIMDKNNHKKLPTYRYKTALPIALKVSRVDLYGANSILRENMTYFRFTELTRGHLTDPVPGIRKWLHETDMCKICSQNTGYTLLLRGWGKESKDPAVIALIEEYLSQLATAPVALGSRGDVHMLNGLLNGCIRNGRGYPDQQFVLVLLPRVVRLYRQEGLHGSKVGDDRRQTCRGKVRLEGPRDPWAWRARGFGGHPPGAAYLGVRCDYFLHAHWWHHYKAPVLHVVV
jgi:hypothetical protein